VAEGTTCTATVTDTDGGTKKHPDRQRRLLVLAVTASSARRRACSTTVDSSHASCTTTYTPAATGNPSLTGAYGRRRGARGQQRLGDGVRQHGHHDDGDLCVPSSVDNRRRDDVYRDGDRHQRRHPSTPTGSVSFSSSPSNGVFSPTPCTLTAVDSSHASCHDHLHAGRRR